MKMIRIKRTYVISTLTFVFMFLSFLTSAQEKSTDIRTINNKKYYIHKVEKGQSLYAISKIYGTDVNVILADNDEAIDGIKAGQELKIPFDLKPANSVKPITNNTNSTNLDTNRYVYHKVVKKETIYSICKQYELTSAQLEAYNPSITSGIKPDQMLIVGEKKNFGKANAQIKAITFNGSGNNTPVLQDSTISIPKDKKEKYNIGLMLPFKIDESEQLDPSVLTQSKANFPQLQSYSVDFLLGFQKALDSLKSADCKVETFIYDVDDKDSAKIESLCKSTEFKSLDLIIGPVYPSGFKTVSAYAKQYSIPLVSPFTQQNKILFKNNLASKTNPSQFTLMEALADYCIDSCKGNSAVFIVNNGMLKEQQYVKAFKNYYNERLKQLNISLKDSVVEVKGLAGAKAKYVEGKKNIYVLFSNNQVYLADFVTQLAVWSDKKDVVLAGWQNVTQTDNIDQEYLNRVNYTFPSQNNIINVKAYSNAILSYQNEMSSDPSDYYFMGFDIAQYYLSHLKQYGPSFISELDKYPFDGNFLRFEFFHPDAMTGFENRGAYIFRYSNYQLYRSQWK